MINSSGQIEIPLSKKKIILMLMGSIGFVIIGLWFVINPPVISNSFFGNPTRLFILGVVAMAIFGLFAIFIGVKLLDKKPGMIIDDTGLTDHSSGVSAGKILWSDIEHISVIEMHRQKLIMLEVKNPQEYIDRQKGALKRKLMQMNFNMYGTPLSITANTLLIEFDELRQILENRIRENKPYRAAKEPISKTPAPDFQQPINRQS